MLKGVQEGYELPEYISEERYKYIKQHKDEDPILAGFVGFGCSFGGKWFGGYARNKENTNYALQSKKSLLNDMATLNKSEFMCNDYQNVVLPDGCFVYADPPYDNTTCYCGEKFDSQIFWQYARDVSKNHLIFISEQHAPDDFIAIWSHELKRTLDVNKHNQPKAVEKLYIHKDWYEKIYK